MTHWPGFRDDGGVILPLDAAGLLPVDAPRRLRLDGQLLVLKQEFHLTLLGRDQGRAARTALGEARLASLFQALDWTIRETGRYALLHKTKQEWDGPLDCWSLVQHLQVPAMAWFRDAVARESGMPLDCGLPHVTLYVAGDPYGIGVPGVDAYRAVFVREVAATELAAT